MALVPSTDETSTSLVLASPGDRTKAFQRARWHSRFVQLLRVVLPICAIGLMASYGLFMQHSIAIETKSHKGVFTTGPITASFENLEMSNPHYEGYNQKDGSRYTISAKKAITDLSPDKPIVLFSIDGSLHQKDGTRVRIEAAKGNFLRESGKLELFNGVRVRSSNGMHARLSRAKVDTKLGRITSQHPVDVWMPTGNVRGNTMILKQKLRELVFANGVTVRLKQKETKSPRGLVNLAGTSSEPVDVTASTLIVKDSEHKAFFDGNVRVVQGTTTLTTRKMDIEYEGSAVATAAGKSTEKKKQSLVDQALVGQAGGKAGAAAQPEGRVRYVVAKGDVVIVQADGTRVVTAIAHFYAKDNLIVLDGGVVMTSEPGRRVLGDRAEIHTDTNTLLLTGRQISLTQGDTVLRGSRLAVDRNAGWMKLSRPGTKGRSSGRISARFVTSSVASGKGAEDYRTRASGPAAGTKGTTGGLTFRTDPRAPVTVKATSMTVKDAIHTAIFRGNVVAEQGGFRIVTPLLSAIYTGGSGLTPGSPQRGAATGRTAETRKSAPAAQLTHIKAEQSVIITSKDGMRAKGTWAIFDVKTNIVTLGGNVMLKQGRQTVRGQKLLIDLNTGLSRVVTGPAGTPSAVARDAGAGNRGPRACGGRMCAVFYPNEFKQPSRSGAVRRKSGNRGGQPKGGQPRQATPSIGQGWSATTMAPRRVPSN